MSSRTGGFGYSLCRGLWIGSTVGTAWFSILGAYRTIMLNQIAERLAKNHSDLGSVSELLFHEVVTRGTYQGIEVWALERASGVRTVLAIAIVLGLSALGFFATCRRLRLEGED